MLCSSVAEREVPGICSVQRPRETLPRENESREPQRKSSKGAVRGEAERETQRESRRWAGVVKKIQRYESAGESYI